MNAVQAKVECKECGNWLSVPSNTELVRCDCGEVYAVTVTHC